MELFKGYVATKNKKCLESFKDRNDLKTIEQVQGLNEFAGILGDETILIDVDNREESEILFEIVKELSLKCRVYETTRGMHFLFRNNGVEKNRTGCKLAVGLTADIKLGCRNSYSILRFKGRDRAILYDTPENDIQSVPKWLTPIVSSIDFLDMEAGDGRNQALFNYILILQSEDFTVEQARETIRIINAHVLKDPLPDRELETILRDDAFKKPTFFKGKDFQFDRFAIYLKNNCYIIRLDGLLHIYREGVYVPGQHIIESEMIKQLPKLNQAKRREVMAYLDLIVTDQSQQNAPNLIAFENGIYDIFTGAFSTDFAPQKIVTNRIPWPYNPNAYDDLMDRTLDRLACGDPQIRALLEEAAGYCLFRRNELGKAFILIGDKSNGKSTFLDLVKTMLGTDNISSLDLRELDSRFKTAELVGKLANIGDDIGDEFIANASIFRKLVTGDRVNVERKGQDPFEFNNYSKFLFSANTIPRIRDKTGAVQRRMVIIPFDAKFSPNDPDFRPYIKYELREQARMEYLIQLSLKGLKRVLETHKFTESKKVQEQMQEYERGNNPVVAFVSEVGLQSLVNNPVKSAYSRYKEFCLVNQFQPVSSVEFSKQIIQRFNLESKVIRIRGEGTVRVLVKGSVNDDE